MEVDTEMTKISLSKDIIFLLKPKDKISALNKISAIGVKWLETFEHNKKNKFERLNKMTVILHRNLWKFDKNKRFIF